MLPPSSGRQPLMLPRRAPVIGAHATGTADRNLRIQCSITWSVPSGCLVFGTSTQVHVPPGRPVCVPTQVLQHVGLIGGADGLASHDGSLAAAGLASDCLASDGGCGLRLRLRARRLLPCSIGDGCCSMLPRVDQCCCRGEGLQRVEQCCCRGKGTRGR